MVKLSFRRSDSKVGGDSVPPALRSVQDAVRAPLAFHVSFSLPYEDVDCFAADRPVVVPARTFLSQLP